MLIVELCIVFVFRYSRVMHNMHIVELCIVLGVKSQLTC